MIFCLQALAIEQSTGKLEPATRNVNMVLFCQVCLYGCNWVQIQMSKKNNYQESSFWQQRYKQNICEWFQWLATPNQFSNLLQKYLPNPCKIVQLGCGSSNLAQKLMTLHHQSVTCLDFSKQVIRNKNKHAKDGVSYKVHDITQPLPFEDDSLDAIIEKNTIDCLFCYQDYPARVMRVMKDCYRVLKDGGVMISISHGREKLRRFFYRNRFSPFNLKVVLLDDLKPGQNQVYMYVLTKGDVENNEEDENIQEEQANQVEDEPQKEEKEENGAIQQAQNEQDNPEPEQKEEQNYEDDPKEEQPGDKKQEEESPQKVQEQKQDEEEQNYEFDELDAEQS